MNQLPKINIYTDGACKGNPGKGGWGVLIESADSKIELFGGEHSTTNNRMEMQAVIQGLSAITTPSSITVYLDSQYVQKGITEWVHGWKHRGWKTSQGSPVKNCDLWVKLDELVSNSEHAIEWKWVKGHAGHPGNERADELANFGVTNQ